MNQAMTASVLGWLFVASTGCGGKTVGDGSPAASSPLPQDAPTPSCSQICDRLVAQCGASPNASCLSDCGVTQTKYATGCPHDLDVFLKCMYTAHVQCAPNEVVVVDCSDQRVQLESCMP